MSRPGRVSAGLIAGACGTAALNMATYLDMAVRGRPSSDMPAQAAQRMAEGLGIDLSAGGDEAVRESRSQGVGALLGYGAGLGATLLYPVAGRTMDRMAPPVQAGAIAIAALLAGNVPSSLLGITDPRRWSAKDWLADLVPHVLYGLVASAAYRAIRR